MNRAEQPQNGEQDPPTLPAAIRQLLRDGRFSDLLVTCQSRQFKVHKAILCTQSPFFDAACNIGLQESSTNVIDLPDDDPDIVSKFFDYLYSGNYSDQEHVDAVLMSGPARMTSAEVSQAFAGLGSPPSQEARGISSLDEGDIWPPMPQFHPHEDPAESSVGPRRERDRARAGVIPAPAPRRADRPSFLVPPRNRVRGRDGDQDAGWARSRANPEDPPPPAIDLTGSLFASLRLYIMADKFLVRRLKLLAAQRFVDTAKNRWMECEQFSSIIEELFENTPPNDSLRMVVCDLIAERYNVAEFRARMRPLLEKHNDLAIGILDKIVSAAESPYEPDRTARSLASGVANLARRRDDRYAFFVEETG